MPEKKKAQLITHVVGRFEPDTVGDVDGDAMCLDVKTADCGQTQPALSLAFPNECNEHGGGGGGGSRVFQHKPCWFPP